MYREEISLEEKLCEFWDLIQFKILFCISLMK